MLAKINRLTKDKDFNNAFKKGRSSYDDMTGIKTAANGLANNRFGILVSTKISKKAAIRNKIKCRVREAIKKYINKLRLGNDLVIICLPGILKKEYKEIEQSLSYHFKKLRILK